MNLQKLETKIFPPALTALLLLLMTAIKYLIPEANFNMPFSGLIALLLFIIGLAFLISANMAFKKAQTTINPFKPEKATALVTSGVFSITRNPMYLGLLFLLLAWDVFLSNLLCLIGPIFLLIYLNRFQIEPEEKAMEKLFGDTYISYKIRIRRWI